MQKFRTQAEAQEDTAQIEYEKQTESALTEIYRQYPQIRKCIASDRMIVELVDRFLGAEPGIVVPSPALFREVMDENPDVLKRLVIVAPEIRREVLIEEICDLLRSPNGDGKGGRYSDADLANERNRMASWSKESLVARKAEVIEAQRLAGKPASEIRADLAAQRQTERSSNPYHPRPRLPKAISGKTVDAAYLKSLPVWELKRVVSVFGNAQVDDRIRGIS